VVFNERKQEVENNPLSAFNEDFNCRLWGEHPYARPVIGPAGEIKALTPQDVKAYYQQHYDPANAILIISGDIDPQTAKTLAEKYYGKIASSNHKPAIIDYKATPKDLPILVKHSPQVQNPRYLHTFIAPDRDYALMVLAKYLGDGKTSELYKNLVLNQKALLDISTDYDGYTRGPGSFGISALLKDPKDPTKLIDQALHKAVANMTEQDLQKTKDKMLSGLVFLKDNPFDAAFLVGYMAQTMSLAEIESWVDSINAVTLKDVKQAWQNLQQSTNQIGLLLPENK